jgi:NTE family protein
MKAANGLRLTIQRLMMPFQWLFIRLPKPFSFPLLILLILHFFLFFPLLVNVVIPFLINYPLSEVASLLGGVLTGENTSTKLVSVAVGLILGNLVLLGSALMTLFFAVFGVLLSYWITSQFYSLYRLVTFRQVQPLTPISPRRDSEVNSKPNPLAQYKRIGIILSGGGAKGAYQAGAMKAIYEFLEEHNAHDNVQMIAATSIGSWNALFWLADLIKSKDGGPGPLEQWWTKVNVQNIILPIVYLPTRQNYLLSNQPWRDNFDGIFNDSEAGKRLLYHAQQPNAADAIRFYFTHSNIGKAHLAFTTNRSEWENVTVNLPAGRARPVVAPGTYSIVNDANELRTLGNIRTGVFSSMDIPPLFPYTDIDNEFFEDGGVIDNLPIRFGTEVEECDLLFILPLNASFERKVDQRSLIRRLARVTEIRQGVLERNSFKMIYLYNELASMRRKVHELENKEKSTQEGRANTRKPPKRSADDKIADRALRRTHNIVRVFSICPGPELRIGTTEFWKTKEAGEAFRFMYEVTRNELKRFGNLVNSTQLRMALVAPAGVENQNGNHSPLDAATDAESNLDNVKPIRKTAGTVDYDVTYFKDF